MNLDLVRTIVQVAAIAVGAVWGYYQFIRSRTFKRRLDATVSGSVLHEGGAVYVRVSSKAKNVGLCKVKLRQAGTAVEILSHAPKGKPNGIAVVNWEYLGTFSIFQKHLVVEPGETIADELLIALPALLTGQVFRLELRIVSKGIEWNALSILEPVSQICVPIGDRLA